MADTNFFELFTVTWAQSGIAEGISDVQYKTGWAYIGSLPPTVEQFNKVQQLTDEKLGWVYRQLAAVAVLTGRPLSAAGDDTISYALQNLNAANLASGTVPVARLAGTAASLTSGAATKLATVRNFLIEGGATAAAQVFDGTSDVKLTVTGLDLGKASAGLLPVARGGTGLGTVGAGEFVMGTGAAALTTKTAAQVLTYIGGAPLDSPALVGVPTAPTAAVGANTAQVATTAFVVQQTAKQIPWMVSADLPAVDKGPVFVIERQEILVWVSGGLFTGYQSPQCGKIDHFATQATPVGWLRANGAAVSRATYAALFAVIGTRFGAGDGSTTFNLPDLRGEFVRGWDDGKGTDPSRAFGSNQTDQLQNHNHAHGILSASGSTSGNQQYTVSSSGNAQNTQGISGSGANPANFGAETRPRNVALLACIKY